MKFDSFIKILENNTKDNPLDIDYYDIQSIINCKKKLVNKFVNFYISFTCNRCNKQVYKNFKDVNCDINFLKYCGKCKSKITCLEKYGCEYSFQSENNLSKSRQTKLDKYGDENYNNKEKHIQTCLEKYGVENYSQTEEYRDRVHKTSLTKYGVDHFTQSEIVKLHAKDTNLDKYGVEWQTQSENFKEKAVKTRKERYGVEYSMQSKELLEKSKKTCREKYGADSYAQSEVHREYMLKTYGSMNVMHRYLYKNMYFDSSWELAFYIYHKDKGSKIEREPNSFDYIKNGVIHKYFPDFKINNKYYEIKGDQYLEFYKNGNPKTLKDNHEKFLCMKKHKVTLLWSKQIKKYIDYVCENYGKDYLDTFNIELFKKTLDGVNLNEILDWVKQQPFPGSKKWPANHPIWDCYLPGKLSPREAWKNEDLLIKALENMFSVINKDLNGEQKYLSFDYNHIKHLHLMDNKLAELILNRFTVAKIAPKVTALSSKTMLKIIEESKIDISNGCYCPMAGFGGIIEACKLWGENHKIKNFNRKIEAYDINNEFCNYYGWKYRNVLSKKIKTNKTVIVCPPFGKNYEHWKGTPNEMSDISFKDWYELIKEYIKAPKYIIIGPELKSNKNVCGLFSKTTGIQLWTDDML